MSPVLSKKLLKEIERGIRAGKCLTLIPRKTGSVLVIDNDEFLTPQESQEFLKSLGKPTPGDVLERFIWEFANGSVKDFAKKIGYHPNRISALKNSRKGISIRLFRRIVEKYRLPEKERHFWAKRLLDV
jgi:hypothetical protein